MSLVDLSNNQVLLPITSLFLVMFSDNGKLSDDLFGHVLGLEVRDMAILFKSWIKNLLKLIKLCQQNRIWEFSDKKT